MRRREFDGRMRARIAIAVVIIANVTSAGDMLSAQARPPVDPRVHLVVVLTLDQFQVPYIDRYSTQFTGGLKRLLDGGAYFPNAWQDHAITETAPAHAALLSGRFPRSTGILRDAADVEDAASPLIGGGGNGASPYRFRGGTLVDWLHLQDPASRALSVSRKPRSAILPLGRSHQPAYWYAHGRFTTSAWFADTLPLWVRHFNDRQLPQSVAGQSWMLLLPTAAYPEPDTVNIENAGRDFVFPHVIPSDTTVLEAIIRYPVMDDFIFAFALEGVRAMNLGGGRHTDILSVSVSTTDEIGHRWGPDSREIHDQVLRLDRALGLFIDSIYAHVDSARVIFAVTADHGITPFPELHAANAQEARDDHVSMRTALGAARAVLRNAGADTTAISFGQGMVLVNRSRLAPGFDVTPALDVFTRAARAEPGVTAVFRRADLAKADTMKDAGARRWIHTLPDDIPAELLLTIRTGAVWGKSTDATHGNSNDIDARVPLFFYGAPFRPGRYTENARSVDIAPTLARVIGVRPYEVIDGRALLGVIRQ